MDPISRRSFLEKATAASAGVGAFSDAERSSATPAESKHRKINSAAPTRYGVARCVTEWEYSSGKAYADPYNEVELDVAFYDAQGTQIHRVPAFWAGDQTWRVRYAAPAPGRYTYRTISSDPNDPDLHGQAGTLEVSAYTGDNPLRKHGPVRVA